MKSVIMKFLLYSTTLPHPPRLSTSTGKSRQFSSQEEYLLDQNSQKNVSILLKLINQANQCTF